jgi:hypothetical protein
MTKVNGTGTNNILSSDLDGVGVTWCCRAQPFGSITAKAEENLEIENNCGNLLLKLTLYNIGA